MGSGLMFETLLEKEEKNRPSVRIFWLCLCQFVALIRNLKILSQSPERFPPETSRSILINRKKRIKI
jgi:hypothetical protein